MSLLLCSILNPFITCLSMFSYCCLCPFNMPNIHQSDETLEVCTVSPEFVIDFFFKIWHGYKLWVEMIFSLAKGLLRCWLSSSFGLLGQYVCGHLGWSELFLSLAGVWWALSLLGWDSLRGSKFKDWVRFQVQPSWTKNLPIQKKGFYLRMFKH